MKNQLSVHLRLPFIAMAIGLSSQAAYGADAQAFLDRVEESTETTFTQAFAQSGLNLKTPSFALKYGELEINGDTAIAPDFQMIISGKDDNEAIINFGNLTISGVSEVEDGGLRAETLRYEKISFTYDKIELSGGATSVTGWVLPKDTLNSYSNPQSYDTTITEDLELKLEGKPIASMAKLEIIQNGTFGKTDLAIDYRVDDIIVALDNLPDAQKVAPIIHFLDSDVLEFDVAASSTWSTEGNFVLNPMSYDFVDLGKFSIQLDIDGMTPEFIERYQKEAATIGSKPEDAMKMLGLLEEIDLNTAQIKLEDASITQKIISLIAQKQGASPDAVKQQAQFLLPLALARLQNPELSEMITSAVSEFLNESNSIQIDLVPEKPLPIAEIVGAGMAAPMTIPQLIGLKVFANQ